MTANEGQDADKLQEKEDSYPICEPEGHRLLGCKSPARRYETLSGYKDFHDGGGLPAMFSSEMEEGSQGASRRG